ncbi:hypothetical protein [Pyruvatibacter sp.]|uniref:hypothetical protein n=1 Tax=Pyruvatibacter sp. TaxID=1981328 RepID=UPI0032EF8D6E
MTDEHILARRMLADMFSYYRLEPHCFAEGAVAGCVDADFASAELRLAILLDAAPDDPRTDSLIDTGWRVLSLSGAQVRNDPGSIRQTLLDTAQALA